MNAQEIIRRARGAAIAVMVLALATGAANAVEQREPPISDGAASKNRVGSIIEAKRLEQTYRIRLRDEAHATAGNALHGAQGNAR